MTQTYSLKNIVMTKKKRKRKITDFDYEDWERSVARRLHNLEFKGILQDTYEEFIVDAGYRNTLEQKDKQAKNN